MRRTARRAVQPPAAGHPPFFVKGSARIRLMFPTLLTRLAVACATGYLMLSTVPAAAHGSVALEDDLCAIQIGYLRAHFKIYLTRTHEHRDFCEDIPAVGETIFVMEYQHAGLSDVPIDFRIIRNVTGMGSFARWEDVATIDDLDAVTVLYQPPSIVPDVFTLLHRFDQPGEFVGIVTAAVDGAEPYTAVFPFEVGFTGFGYWPLIVLLAVALQLNYWFMSGRLKRRQAHPVRAVRVTK